MLVFIRVMFIQGNLFVLVMIFKVNPLALAMFVTESTLRYKKFGFQFVSSPFIFLTNYKLDIVTLNI